jgi:hypothetical protein
VTLHQLSQACVFIYSSHGKWVFPPLLQAFLPPLLQAFLLLIAGCVPPLLPSLARLVVRNFPSPHLRCSVHPALFAYYSIFFPFLPGWGSVCPGDYADLAQGRLWEYRVLLSSPCGPHLPKPSGCCHLAAVQEPS